MQSALKVPISTQKALYSIQSIQFNSNVCFIPSVGGDNISVSFPKSCRNCEPMC